jgi:hypothetical protein
MNHWLQRRNKPVREWLKRILSDRIPHTIDDICACISAQYVRHVNFDLKVQIEEVIRDLVDEGLLEETWIFYTPYYVWIA